MHDFLWRCRVLPLLMLLETSLLLGVVDVLNRKYGEWKGGKDSLLDEMSWKWINTPLRVIIYRNVPLDCPTKTDSTLYHGPT